jgi:chromate transporter
VTATYLRLVYVFSVLSVLGFGGGKGIIPQMHTDTVTKYGWVTNDQFTQFYTIGKLVPGPTTIFAALIGYAAGGIPAAAIAAAAMFVPAAILMFVATAWWRRLPQTDLKAAITGGLAPVIVGLIWSSVLSVGKGVPHTPAAFAIIGVVTALSLWTKLQAPVLILAAGAAGLAVIR